MCMIAKPTRNNRSGRIRRIGAGVCTTSEVAIEGRILIRSFATS